MSVASEIERIKTNIANAYTEIENKGVVTTCAKNSDNLASTISAIQTGGTGGGEVPEKGLAILGWDDEGYVTGVEVVGLTVLPDYYLYMAYRTFLKKATIKLSNDLTSIGAYNFYYTDLAVLEIPDSVTYLGNYCFAYASNANTKLKLPAKLTGIGENCFYGCNIGVVDIPAGVTVLPPNAFNTVKSKVIIIRGGITSIGKKCFYAASSTVEAIIFTNVRDTSFPVPQTQSDSFDRIGAHYVYVPDEYIDKFKNGTNWNSVRNKLKPLSELPDEYKELL